MKKGIVPLFLFASMIVFSSRYAEAAVGWSLIKNSEGIKLYERQAGGNGLMEFMAVTAIDVPIEVIGEAVRDVTSFSRWLADCSFAEVKKQFTRDDMIIYMVLNPPLIDDRDLVLKSGTEYDYGNGRASISFIATDEQKVPLQNGRVRVTMMTGFFDMESLGRNKTKFSYRLKVDPAGGIPKNLAYGVMKSYPYISLKNLKAIAAEKKYFDAARGSADEKKIDSIVNDGRLIKKLLSNRLSRFVKNKNVLCEIIDSDEASIKTITSAKADYQAVEAATKNYFAAYLEKTLPDSSPAGKPAADREFIDAVIDMVSSECGAEDLTVEKIIAGRAYK